MTPGGKYALAFEFLTTQRFVTGWVILVVDTVAFGALWWIAGKPHRAFNNWKSRRKLNPGAFVSLMIAMVAWYLVNRSLVAEMFGGETVEGAVGGFVRADDDRGQFNKAEFSVGEVPFRVTYHHGGAAELLALPEWSGGPLRDGLNVRVRHHGGKILRIEVWEP